MIFVTVLDKKLYLWYKFNCTLYLQLRKSFDQAVN